MAMVMIHTASNESIDEKTVLKAKIAAALKELDGCDCDCTCWLDEHKHSSLCDDICLECRLREILL